MPYLLKAVFHFKAVFHYPIWQSFPSFPYMALWGGEVVKGVKAVELWRNLAWTLKECWPITTLGWKRYPKKTSFWEEVKIELTSGGLIWAPERNCIKGGKIWQNLQICTSLTSNNTYPQFGLKLTKLDLEYFHFFTSVGLNIFLSISLLDLENILLHDLLDL